MTDTKDEEAKQTEWEAGFEAGWRAAKKSEHYGASYELGKSEGRGEGYLIAMERRRRETDKISIDLPLKFPLPPIERVGGDDDQNKP